MKIRVPGCHGSEQVIERESGPAQCRTCGFLVNGTVMVDARTIGTALTLQEQKRIRHILLSHLHFDHIQGLPTLADNLAMMPPSRSRSLLLKPRSPTKWRKIGRPDLPVFVYHLKPRLQSIIRQQLMRLGMSNLTILEEGQEITI
ncbi:MAG: MBL fold metallo-hydrolase [Nitrospiraceae bacterium]